LARRRPQAVAAVVLDRAAGLGRHVAAAARARRVVGGRRPFVFVGATVAAIGFAAAAVWSRLLIDPAIGATGLAAVAAVRGWRFIDPAFGAARFTAIVAAGFAAILTPAPAAAGAVIASALTIATALALPLAVVLGRRRAAHGQRTGEGDDGGEDRDQALHLANLPQYRALGRTKLRPWRLN